MLAVGALFVDLLSGPTGRKIGGALQPFVERPHTIHLSAADLAPLLLALLRDVGQALALPVLLFLAAALGGGLSQNGLVISTEPLQLKPGRLSPVAGLKRLVSARALIEFLKGVLKLVLVGALATLVLWSSRGALFGANQLDAAGLLVLLGQLAVRLLAAVAALVGVLALADMLYQRFEHRKQLRMSRRDLQDEFKQTEGDPQLKARLKSLRAQRARQRMMAEVPKSTVVITNPEHVAVALRYDGAMAAPEVVAKGRGDLAQRIRMVAREHRVPVVENPPLARALHTSVRIGETIPPVHYQAVAEIIGFVLRQRAR
jgi:flagellar biosynthetic protein FlhB